MKILFIVVGSFVLLIVLVVLIGMILPKAHVASRAAWYKATPERLFTLISGPQTWRPEVTHFEVVADSAGRDLVRETTRNGETVMYEILDRRPPQSIKRRIATENLPYAGTWIYILQPDSSGTVLRITENGEVYNPVFRFISRFIIGHTRTIDAYLQALGKATGQEVQPTN